MGFTSNTHRLSGDHGAVLVEFAIVFPVLVTFALGIFEFGTLFRQQSTLSATVQVLARTDTNLGSDRFAEWNALLAWRSGFAKVDNMTVDYIIVFKAPQGTVTAPPPAQCIADAEAHGPGYLQPQGRAGVCNIYSTAQLNAVDPVDPSSTPAKGFQCAAACTPTTNATCLNGAAGAWDQWWCPSSRQADMADNGGVGPDYVGVYAKTTYRYVTKVVPGATKTMTELAVFRVEPT